MLESIRGNTSCQRKIEADQSNEHRKKEDPKADEINLALPMPSQMGVGKSTRKDQNQQASEKGLRDATALRASIVIAEGSGQPAASSRQLEFPEILPRTLNQKIKNERVQRLLCQ